MNGIPDFLEAVSDFREFLVEQGHPNHLVWVFCEDLWFRTPDDVLMHFPPAAENKSLAKKVYDEGRERGLVEITAVATANAHVATTVWFPKFPTEEVQGWSQGLKLSIRQPLPAAKVLGGLKWRVVQRLSGYRWYQQSECSIGSRRWAAA